MRYISRMRHPLIRAHTLIPILRAPRAPWTLAESVSDAKRAIRDFSLEIGTTHHVYEAPRSSFVRNSCVTIYNETIFTIHNRPSYRRRIIERSTAPFVIIANRRRVSSSRREYFRRSRDPLANVPFSRIFRKIMQRRATLCAPDFVYISLHESDKIGFPWIHRSIRYKECREQQGRHHRETLHVCR